MTEQHDASQSAEATADKEVPPETVDPGDPGPPEMEYFEKGGFAPIADRG